MIAKRNDYAISYTSGREFARAAAAYGKSVFYQDYHGAPVLFFDDGTVRHYLLGGKQLERDYDVLRPG